MLSNTALIMQPLSCVTHSNFLQAPLLLLFSVWRLVFRQAVGQRGRWKHPAHATLGNTFLQRRGALWKTPAGGGRCSAHKHRWLTGRWLRTVVEACVPSLSCPICPVPPPHNTPGRLKCTAEREEILDLSALQRLMSPRLLPCSANLQLLRSFVFCVARPVPALLPHCDLACTPDLNASRTPERYLHPRTPTVLPSQGRTIRCGTTTDADWRHVLAYGCVPGGTGADEHHRRHQLLSSAVVRWQRGSE